MSPYFSMLVRVVPALVLAACGALPVRVSMDTAQWQRHLRATELPAALLLGEQHDAAEHQQWERETLQVLMERQQLAAVVLEMADQGLSTQGLPATASEAQVQQALQWNAQAWPWHSYGPAVMHAVRAGIPVVGGNLPRSEMKMVMQQPHWDRHLPALAWEHQRDAIRTGHCNLLPESQITPMARIQLAKDARMAQTITQYLEPGKTVLLLAGRGHVLRNVGVPTWLPAHVHYAVAVAQAGEPPITLANDSDYVVQTPALPDTDHCTSLRQKWKASTNP